MLDYQTKGYSSRGASMGRGSDLPDGAAGALSIRKVPLDQGGYDPGGAYWGTPDNLYMVSDAEGRVSYMRGSSFDAVKAHFPDAVWLSEVTAEDIADMAAGYAECALWSSNDESTPSGGEPFDANYSVADLSEETVKAFADDCARFAEHNVMTLAALATVTDIDWSKLGHDFWLTRNGHGAGFGDGDYPDPWDDLLKESCGWRTDFGEVYIYLGDDGKIHGG